MRTRVFIPQPIPEVALDRLKKVAEVEVFPHVDRITHTNGNSTVMANGRSGGLPPNFVTQDDKWHLINNLRLCP